MLFALAVPSLGRISTLIGGASLIPLLNPNSNVVAVFNSISALISSAFVFGSVKVGPPFSNRIFRHSIDLPRNLLNWGAGFCRSCPSRDKLNRRGTLKQPFQPCPPGKPLSQPQTRRRPSGTCIVFGA